MARIQVSIDDAALAKIDGYVEAAGLSRSSFIALAALEYIRAKEAAPVISGVMAQFAQIFDARVRGELSPEEATQRLDVLSDAVKAVTGK